MNAEDLMIGDWVYDTILQGYTRVKVLTARGIQGDIHDNIWDEKTFEAIPLTPEILEKNGFEFGYTTSEEEFCSATGCGYPEEKGWCYDEGAGEIKIIFPTQSDGGLIRLDDQSFDRHLEIVYVKTIMVHELQHALRLCGIEKEITI